MQTDGEPDVLAGDPLGESWTHRWRTLPAGARVGVLCLVVSALLVGAVLAQRSWAAGREADRRVDLSLTLGVSSSSTTPLGGQVEYFVTVRNDGRRAITVAEVASVSSGLEVTGTGPLSIDPGAEALLSLSALVTCGPTVAHAPVAGGPARTLDGQVAVVRYDGETTVSEVFIAGPGPLLDAASTLCSVRPELRAYEMSGPTVR